MNIGFYTAARGALVQQEKLNIVANNMANVNNNGYKAKTPVFLDLLHFNMRAAEGEETNLKAGTGAKISHTNTDFTGSGLTQTASLLDFAITGNEGFFMLEDPATGDITYTRSGNFFLSDRGDAFYLATDGGKLVLDAQGNRITAVDGAILEQPGVYTFTSTDGFLSVGSNEFLPQDKNGAPILMQDARVVTGFLEMSNVDTAREMVYMIESSSAYSMALKMMQTVDETEQTVNNLR